MWDAPTIIATVIGGLGLVLAVIGLWWQYNTRSSDRARAKTRLRVAEQLERGHEVQAKLPKLDGNGPWGEMEEEIDAWHSTTLDALPREYRPLFESSAGMAFLSSPYTDYSRLNHHMNGRLARLGEILSRI